MNEEDEHAQDWSDLAEFFGLVREKMLSNHNKGRAGWRTLSCEQLLAMLREHIDKGDMRDVAILAMMVHTVEVK